MESAISSPQAILGGSWVVMSWRIMGGYVYIYIYPK